MDVVQIGKREQNRIQNRNLILNAARECFREYGYDRVTIRDIIRKTPLAAGTFYNYFSDKKDIFAALLSDFLSRINDQLRLMRENATSEEAFVRNTYYSLFKAAAEDPLVYELAHRNEQAIRELFGGDILTLAMSTLEKDVREAIQRGLFPEVDGEYLTAAFFGVAYEMSMRVAQRARLAQRSPEEEATEAAGFATHLFLGGMARIAQRAA